MEVIFIWVSNLDCASPYFSRLLELQSNVNLKFDLNEDKVSQSPLLKCFYGLEPVAVV